MDEPTAKRMLPIAYPFRPRAFHAGYYGYHRGSPVAPTGTLSQRIDQLATIIYDAKRMAELTRDEVSGISNDSIPVELAPMVWEQQRMITPPWQR